MVYFAAVRKIDVKQVLVLVNTSGASGRNMLGGIFDYANGGRKLSLHLADESAKSASEIDSMIARGKIHGIIAVEHRLPDAPKMLKDSKIPLGRPVLFHLQHAHGGFVDSHAAEIAVRLASVMSISLPPSRKGDVRTCYSYVFDAVH